MKDKIKSFNNSELFTKLSSYFGTIMIVLFMAQLNLLFMQVALKVSVMELNIFVLLFTIFFFVVFKSKASEGHKKLGYKLFKASLVVGAMCLVNHVIITGLARITDAYLVKAISKVIYFIDTAIFITSFAVFRNEKVAKILDNMYEQSLMTSLTGEEEEFEPGDGRIGLDLITNKPVRLPLNDRFLHMLILGPTGCGKTSQIILPMINQDMQCPDIGITVIEPKGDLAEKVYAMAKLRNRKVTYFNPILPDCPYYNPLYGDEVDVIENMATTFKMLSPDSSTFFSNQAENLIRMSVKALKRLYKNDATLLHLNTLIHNAGGAGKKMIMEFSKLPTPNEDVAKENSDIASWFMNDYFTGSGGDSRQGTKTYEHTSGIRTQVAKLVSNEYLRKVFNPPPGVGTNFDFAKALENGDVITISTAQGSLRELGSYLGYFIILQLQSSVFKRPGNEFTRRPNMLYIDEFQLYANPGFSDMLTQGRSYRVASHLATQARSQMAMGSGSDGRAFVSLVSTNARNKIIYPGVSYEDAKYYSDEFGQVITQKVSHGESRQKFNPLYGFGLKAPTQSTSVSEMKENRFSPSDIIYRPFKQVTYCIIKNNSIGTPSVTQIEYIPKDLNEALNKMVAEFNDTQVKKSPKYKDEIEKRQEQEKLEVEQYMAFFKETTVIKDPIIDSDESFIDDGESSAKTKNNPVMSEDDLEIVDISYNIDIEDEEDDAV